MNATAAGSRGRRLPRIGATPILAAAMAISAAYIVVLGSQLSFLLDDWTFIIDRRGFNVDAFMQPDNEHFVAGPVLIWKLLLDVFGIGSTVPFRLVSTALFLLGAWLMFVWIRRRLGEWPALIATIPVLFLGAAFDDLLWFASITFLGSMACGLGMLVALDRRDRAGDRLACLWLIGSMLFSSLWLAFAAGALVDIFLRRRDRSWRGRAFLLVVPVVLYAIWWLGWGHTAESALSVHNLATTPLFVLDSIAAGIAALLGLAIPTEGIVAPNGLDWGRPIAVALIGLAGWRMYKLERIPRTVWITLAIGLAFWILGGLDVKSGRSPSASRYQYPGGVFLLLFAASLLQGVRLKRRLLGPALVVLLAAVIPNIVFFNEAFESYRSTSRIERADLGAVEIARAQVKPGFVLGEEIADTGYVAVEAGPYLSARDAYGSPAYSPAEIASAPEAARVPADKVLAAALEIELKELGGAPAGAGKCRTLTAGEAAPAVLEVPPGGVALHSSAPLQLSLGRFASTFPVAVGSLSPGRWAQLSIPPDAATAPWRLELTGSGTVTACGPGENGN